MAAADEDEADRQCRRHVLRLAGQRGHGGAESHRAGEELPAAPLQAARSLLERSRVAVVAAIPVQRETISPLRSSKTIALPPEVVVFSALRPPPSERAVTGTYGDRPRLPRGTPRPAPTASAPVQSGSLRPITLSRTIRCATPPRSAHSTATDAAFAPAKAASSMPRTMRKSVLACGSASASIRSRRRRCGHRP